MKKIDVNHFFEKFPIEPEAQLELLEEYHNKYPASHFVTFFYSKMLQERIPRKYELYKSKFLRSILNRNEFYNSKLEYFPIEYLPARDTTGDKPDEIAVLVEQLQQNIPKIKFDPDKHDADMNFAEQGEIEDIEFLSETLAMVYAKQGYTGTAIQMLKKLIVLNPEKNAYFAALIEEVKNLTNHSQYLVENNH